MGWFSRDTESDEDSYEAQAHKQVSEATLPEHKASLTHELIAAAAAYEATRLYEKECEAHGAPASHDQAKALLAGLAAAYIDKLVEERGFDFDDEKRERLKATAAEKTDKVSFTTRFKSWVEEEF